MKYAFSFIARFWACLMTAGLLTACGGGGGGSPAPVATEMAAFYLGAADAREFWAVSAPSGAGREFYAVSYPGQAFTSSAAMIYSGSVVLGIQGGATLAVLNANRENGSTRTGSASFKDVSARAMEASFTLNDASDVMESASFTATQGSPLDALTGAWSGRWTDGLRSNSALALTGLAAGGKFFITPLAACPDVELSLDALPATPGLYRVQLKYPTNEQCFDRNNRTLNGLAVVHVAGGQQQLRLVAVDSVGSGSGISFVGRRPLP